MSPKMRVLLGALVFLLTAFIYWVLLMPSKVAQAQTTTPAYIRQRLDIVNGYQLVIVEDPRTHNTCYVWVEGGIVCK